jgi:hypothetical protein
MVIFLDASRIISEGGKIITVKFILGHKLYLGEYIYIDPKSDLGGTNIN